MASKSHLKNVFCHMRAVELLKKKAQLLNVVQERNLFLSLSASPMPHRQRSIFIGSLMAAMKCFIRTASPGRRTL